MCSQQPAVSKQSGWAMLKVSQTMKNWVEALVVPSCSRWLYLPSYEKPASSTGCLKCYVCISFALSLSPEFQYFLTQKGIK